MQPSSLTPELLLEAYRHGIFPMAESRDDPHLHWFCPDPRGILPLDGFHLPRSLGKTVRQNIFTVTLNKAFPEVIRRCADARAESWINGAIIALYEELSRQGHAHSVECWQEGRLVGGLYGVSVGAAFCGESMFSATRDASKVALVWLVAALKSCGYRLLDTQYITPHLARLGAVEIPQAEYLARLQQTLAPPLPSPLLLPEDPLAHLSSPRSLP